MDNKHIKSMIDAAENKNIDEDLTIKSKGKIALRLRTWEDVANAAAYDTVIHNNMTNM